MYNDAEEIELQKMLEEEEKNKVKEREAALREEE